MNFSSAALDGAIAARAKEKKLPGVSVCIYGPDGVLFKSGYGFADMEKQRPVDGDTVYGIASMSKSMTALAISILESEGKLSFDDPVTKYFPRFGVPGLASDAITVRHLLNHTAGIPPMEPLEWSIVMNSHRSESEWARKLRATAPNSMETIDEIVDYIASCPHPTYGGPGEYMSYSNEGYAILSYIVDMASGTTLELFLRERVFGPLSMTRTVLDLDGSEAAALAGGNITSLFDTDDSDALACDDAWSILPPFRGCACVKSTALDMARYYACLSNGGMLDGKRLIPERAVESMVGNAFPTGEKAHYCFGLNKRSKFGHVFCEHSGGLHGVSSFGGFLKGEGYGIAVLCNKGDEDSDLIGHMMYNAVIGEELSQSHLWLTPRETAFGQMSMLEGEYICYEGIPETLTVKAGDGCLDLLRGETHLKGRWCGETWFLTYKDGSNTPAGRLRFFIRDDRAWGVQVYTRIFMRL